MTVAAIRTTNPLDGALVAGSVTWTALATAPAKRVNFLIDGTRVATDSSAPYEYAWNTAAYAGNNHHLTVRAYWSSGSSADSVDVGVENAVSPADPASEDPTASPVYPASFYTGPAGTGNILPPRAGAFLGIWEGGAGMTWEEQKQQLLEREAQVGRRFDIVGLHYAAPRGTCYWGSPSVPFSEGRETWVDQRGSIPYVSWTPGWTLDQLNAGQADSCLHDVARRAKASGVRAFLRPYWEFNDPGAWWYFGNDPVTFRSAWRRMVDIFRAEGANNLSWVWCPSEGYYRGAATDQSFEAYPGDGYVDWVCSDGYNRGTAENWCGNYQGWCPFESIFHAAIMCGCSIQEHDSVEIDFRGIKPYMVGETGSNEDPEVAGRKGQWHLAAREAIKARFPGLAAFVYFDQDVSGVESGGNNWRLDTSQSSLNGFRDLAQDAYFRTRG